jgi:predicted anti-sigma-YlaC factor YlaD
MKIKCQLIREQWESYKNGASLNFQVIREITNHLTTCPACKEFVYQHSLYPFFKESYGEEVPEPSERFFDNLAKKLDEVKHHTQEISFIGILSQKGWKLVPVMTVLLVLLFGSFAYQYKNISTLATHTPLEEVVLFEDTPLNEYYVLSAITTEELKNEQ